MGDIVDVDYDRKSDNKSYYELKEISKILEVEEVNIVYWCNKFNDFLNIKSIGQYQIFDNYDIKNLKVIKEYNLNQGLSVNETKEKLNQTQEIILKKDQNAVEVSMLEIFSKIMQMQNQKIDNLVDIQNKILEMNEKLINSQNKTSDKLENSIKEISVDIQNQQDTLNVLSEKITNSNESIKDDLKDVVTSQFNLVNEHINNQEQQATQKIDNFMAVLEERRKKHEEDLKEKEKNKGFFGKIFGK